MTGNVCAPSTTAATTCTPAPLAAGRWPRPCPSPNFEDFLGSVPKKSSKLAWGGLAAEDLAGEVVERCGDVLAVVANDDAIDEDVVDPFGRIGNEAFAIGGHVVDPPERTGGDAFHVEDDEVG